MSTLDPSSPAFPVTLQEAPEDLALDLDSRAPASRCERSGE